MFKLLSLIISHFYNLSQWADKLYDRFTVKNTWTTGVQYPSGWNNSSTYQFSSFGNIIHLHCAFQKTSNFSTGDITNTAIPTLIGAPDPWEEIFDKIYEVNSELTEYPKEYKVRDNNDVLYNIYGGQFADIKASYCLSVIDGGLKSITLPAPTATLSSTSSLNNFVGDSSTHIQSYTWNSNVNAVQTADAYVQIRAFTVGRFYNLNPYPMLRQ